MPDLVQKITAAVVAAAQQGPRNGVLFRDAMEQAIRQSLADAGGAVAWQYRAGPGDDGWSIAFRNEVLAEVAAKNGQEVRALYTHPASPADRVAELEAAIAAYLSAVDESEPVGASDQTRYVLHKKVVNARIAMRKALAAEQEKNDA